MAALAPSSSDITIPDRSVIRLIQCSRCSLPLRSPLRLPCGNTFCRSCLPPVRRRVGISYPASEGRDQGFTCYWTGEEGCVGEHCLGDCAADVLLAKLMDILEEAEGVGSGGIEMPKEIEPEEQTILEKAKESIRNELDCQVCYSLILDPLTTPCGHTFCRKCVARILDHSDLCPICRRKLYLPPSVESEPINKRIGELIDHFFSDQVAARRDAVARDESGLDHERTLPLFVCTLAFPTMPTVLHIFEPRYRLMIRRVMENGKKFGMVTYNRTGRPQGELGRTQFMQYGTLMSVDRFELVSDGTYRVVATGLSRFKVIESGMLNGYHVGRVERVDDVSLTTEENLESMETAAAVDGGPPAEGNPAEAPLESLSTQQLLQLSLDFVQKQQTEGAPWLHLRVLLAYGNAPTDPARFPWWLASVLPVSEAEKYALLSATSVRERLKITARWVRKLESREWSTRPSLLSVL